MLQAAAPAAARSPWRRLRAGKASMSNENNDNNNSLALKRVD